MDVSQRGSATTGRNGLPKMQWTASAWRSVHDRTADESFAEAGEDSEDGPVEVEFLRPWPRYAFTAEENPLAE